MGKIDTLQKVELEIAEGKLGIARDRLHGLIVAYPDDMSLRSGLGDVYYKLGYPKEAGRYWFLDADLPDEKLEAVRRFLEGCNNDPAVVLRKLKIRSQPERLSMKSAQEKIEELIAECKKRGLEPPTVKRPAPSVVTTGNFFGFGCFAAILLILVLAFIGLITVVNFGRSF